MVKDVLQHDSQSLNTIWMPSALYFKSGPPTHIFKCHESIKVHFTEAEKSGRNLMLYM